MRDLTRSCQSDGQAALAKAKAAFQGQLLAIKKGAQNPFIGNWYAAYENVVQAIQPMLADCGLAYSHLVFSTAANECGVWVGTKLMEVENGEWEYAAFFVPATRKDKGSNNPVSSNDAQSIGSAISYGKRYGLISILGLPQADDDGESAVGRGKAGKAAQKSPEPPPPTPEEQEKKKLGAKIASLMTDQNLSAADLRAKVAELFPHLTVPAGSRLFDVLSTAQLKSLLVFLGGKARSESEAEKPAAGPQQNTGKRISDGQVNFAKGRAANYFIDERHMEKDDAWSQGEKFSQWVAGLDYKEAKAILDAISDTMSKKIDGEWDNDIPKENGPDYAAIQQWLEKQDADDIPF